MARVIIQPAADTGAQQHLKDTIYNPVPLTRMHPFLEIRDQQRIARLCPAGTAQVWGVRPGAKSTWAKIQVGDAAYFSAKNKLFLKATVLDTFENQGLAEDLWGNHLDGDTWSCIYLVGNVGPSFNTSTGFQHNGRI